MAADGTACGVACNSPHVATVAAASQVVSATLCISLLTGALVLIRDVLISFGNLGIFVKIVNKMLFRDIGTWMVLFGLYVVVFALALNLVMPKTQAAPLRPTRLVPCPPTGRAPSPIRSTIPPPRQ